MNWNSDLIRRIIRLALDEDLQNGDITSETLVDPAQPAKGFIRIKQPGVICGLPLLALICEEYQRGVADSLTPQPLLVSLQHDDGFLVTESHLPLIVATVTGSLSTLLSLERTFLNFLQRMSGVATITHDFVAAAKKNKILDTRKTMPGMRLLEKYAVTVGGGKNHRSTLSELILVKNNQIDGVGGDFTVLKKRLEQVKTPYVPVEVEVRTIAELQATLATIKPNCILLDNFDDAQIIEAITLIRKSSNSILIEVSGGLTKDRIQTLSQKVNDVHFSIGSLTTGAKNIDISMKIEPITK